MSVIVGGEIETKKKSNCTQIDNVAFECTLDLALSSSEDPPLRGKTSSPLDVDSDGWSKLSVPNV